MARTSPLVWLLILVQRLWKFPVRERLLDQLRLYNVNVSMKLASPGLYKLYTAALARLAVYCIGHMAGLLCVAGLTYKT